MAAFAALHMSLPWHECEVLRCQLCYRLRGISGLNAEIAETARMTPKRIQITGQGETCSVAMTNRAEWRRRAIQNR